MKSFIVLALFATVAFARPADDKDAYVVKYDNDNIGVEGYNVNVETSNGIVKNEQAVLNNVGKENAFLSVRGQFSYPGPDGVVYTVNYIADENGFQPSGAHLPTPVQ